MLTVRSTINIASQTVPPIIPVVQGDTGRAILFTLADFTIPAGATATYYVQKPSGEAVYNNATIDGNNVLVELTAQSIIEKGDNYGQVRITVGEEVVTSFDFILLVKEFRGIDAVQSLTEMNIFDKAVEQASEAIDEVKTDALEAIDDAKDAALQEIDQSTGNFADDFSASITYAAGDYVMHSGQLYRFTANHAAGAWTGSDAEAVTVGEELTDLKAESTSLKEDLGDINDLETTDKSNIVAAINEAAHSGGSGLTDTQKELIIMILRNAMYTSDQSGNINDLEDAFANIVISISATLDLRGNTIYSDDTLDTLRQYLVVRATYDDGSTQTVTGYALSGSLTVGTSTIQVIYRDAAASVNVPVSQAVVRYTVTNNLAGVTNSNTDASIAEGNTYTGILTAETTGYIPTNVSVTVGGTDVTSTAYDSSTHTITITNVQGNIVISASESEDPTLPVYTLATPMTESGAIDYVLFDQDRDWTILWTVSTPANSGSVHFENLASNRSHPFEAYTDYVGGTGSIRIWDTQTQALNTSWLDGTVAGEQKIVITHDVDGDTKGYWYQSNMKSGRESYGRGSKTLTVGTSTVRSDTGITVTISGNAVLEDFKMYKRILTDDEISDYVGWTVNE